MLQEVGVSALGHAYEQTSEKQVKQQLNSSGYEYKNVLAGGPLFLLCCFNHHKWTPTHLSCEELSIKVNTYASEQTLYCVKITYSIMCNCWITHFQLTLLPLLPSLCPLSSSLSALLSDCSFLCLCSCRSSLQERQCSGFRYCMLTQYSDVNAGWNTAWGELSHWVDVVLPTYKACLSLEQNKPYSPSQSDLRGGAASGWVTVFTRDQTAPKSRL